MLGDAGYAAVTTTTDSRRVLELYRSTRPDLIVLDLMMPQLLEGTADAGLARRAGQIRRAADRCVRIVRNFLSLARQHPPERMETSLTQVARGALELLAYELRTDDVELVLELPDNLPVLWADPHQLHQVLVNIIANAHHAMRRQPGPKRITIRARHAGGRVRVEIADTGRGIPPEILSRIFEPFFTTKPAGEGTGLGLSLCRSIVEEHGGTITVESVPGQGATFVIELPLPDRTQASAAAPTADALPAIGAKHLLVVDDEAEIAHMLAEILTESGHHIDIASNGAEALELLGKGRYDLILSDTKMPVLDGASFYRELKGQFPELGRRVIFLTGDVLDRAK